MFQKALITFLLLSSTNTLAQSKLDSLKMNLSQNIQKVSSVKRDSICTNLIRNIYSLGIYSDFSFQKYWSDSLTNFAKVSKWPETKGYAYLTSAIFNHRSGNTKLSIIYYEKAINVFYKTNKKAYANAITNLTTIISLNLLNYNIEDSTTLKRYLKYIEESIRISIEDGNKVYISTNLITKALFYMVQNRHDFALPIFKLANTYTNKTTADLAYNYHVSLAGQGICYLNLNQENKGLALLTKAKATSKSKVSSDEEKYLYTLICIFESKYLLKKGQNEKVKNYALNTLKAGKHLNFPIFINQLNNLLFLAYKNLNESETALEYLEKITNYKEKEEMVTSGISLTCSKHALANA